MTSVQNVLAVGGLQTLDNFVLHVDQLKSSNVEDTGDSDESRGDHSDSVVTLCFPMSTLFNGMGLTSGPTDPENPSQWYLSSCDWG